jgi:Domain of unknown function (DUF4276)
MKKIFIVVEGETEERFLRKVLYNDFITQGIHIEAQQWLTNRKLGIGGGGNNFDLIENHLRRLMARYEHDRDVFISVMVDLYAFPKAGNTVYDAEVTMQNSGKNKALLLQNKMAERMNYQNFIPYVQLHEYEALLLSKPDALLSFYTDKAAEIEGLKKEINGMQPEDINETPQGAPSKRIIKYLPRYEKQKTTAGVSTAEKIGLPFLRENCLHFNDWVKKLESI